MQRASLYIVIALLAWCPFFFGSNRVLPWWINFAATVTAVILYVLPVIRGEASLPVQLSRYSTYVVLVLAALAWAVIQLVPLDIDVLSNPVWAHARDLTGIERAGRITANPMMTEYSLLRIVTCALLGWLVLQLASDVAIADRLYRTLLWSAAVYGVYGLVQWTFTLNSVLWLKLPYFTTSLTSTFINRNNAATYFGMISQIALAQLMRTYIRSQGGRDWVLREKVRRLVNDKLDVIGQGMLLFLFFASVTILTDSRAGVMFTIVGWLMVGGLNMFRDGRISLTGAAVGLAFAGLVVLVVNAAGDGLAERLFRDRAGDASRYDFYRISLIMIADYPWLGTGLGSWSTMFGIYRDGTIPPGPIYDKAHNTYLELLLGLGLPIAAVFLSAYVLAFGRVIRGYFQRERNRIYTCVAAAATVQVGLHSLTDFSMQIQAVAMVHTALLAIGVAQSWSSRRQRR